MWRINVINKSFYLNIMYTAIRKASIKLCSIIVSSLLFNVKNECQLRLILCSSEIHLSANIKQSIMAILFLHIFPHFAGTITITAHIYQILSYTCLHILNNKSRLPYFCTFFLILPQLFPLLFPQWCDGYMDMWYVIHRFHDASIKPWLSNIIEAF